MRSFRTVVPIAIAIAILLTANMIFAQSCPMCKESMTQAGKKLSDGFYYSILEMAFIPLGMIAGGAVFVLKATYQKQHPDSTLSTVGIIRELVRGRYSK